MTGRVQFKKITYFFVGVLILTTVGFNIYQHQRNKLLFSKHTPENVIKKGPNSKSNSVSNSTLSKIGEKNILPVSEKESQESVGNNDLQDNLNSIEEEIDKTSEELFVELNKKNSFKKAYEQFSKNLSSNPAFQKTIRDSMTQSLLKQYDPLFKKLDISKEDFDEFKNILADRVMEIQNVMLPDVVTASDEDKTEMNQKIREINLKYKDRVNDFLGEENSKIYASYQQSLSERSSLGFFMETVPADIRISENQTEALIDKMYEARKAVYDQTGPDIDLNSSANLTEENVNRYIDRMKMVYDKYLEVSRSVLPDDQAEQYKAYLSRVLNSTESTLRTRLFMNEND